MSISASELQINKTFGQGSEQQLLHEGSAPLSNPKRIWIDLDNSPHVPFFAPIIEELKKSGHTVFVTARDCFQVYELADLLHLDYQRIGRHYGKHTVLKLAGLGWRSMQLLPEVLRQKPHLAISHGSRSQLLVANLLKIPSVTLADYEFAKIWMLVRPSWVITPDIIPSDRIPSVDDRILKYPGIKEDVYVPRFQPDSSALDSLGMTDASDVMVLLRPPATEAHYHRAESDELFGAVLDFLGNRPNVRLILLPRNERQAQEIRRRRPRLFVTRQAQIPSRVVDGLNLIWHSDLVISGGGTMNREAAALGVPVYSIFRGEIGAVDRYLASQGRLTLIEHPREIPGKLQLKKRIRPLLKQYQKNPTLAGVLGQIQSILDRTN